MALMRPRTVYSYDIRVSTRTYVTEISRDGLLMPMLAELRLVPNDSPNPAFAHTARVSKPTYYLADVG